MKKYLFFDSAKCSACGACALACIDQNDVDVAGGQQPFRHTFTLENKQGDLSFHSVSCMHCADAPCVTGCPCGCLTKDAETGFTRLPRLRQGLPLRRAQLWPGRQDAQVRRLHRAPARRDAACLRQGLPHGRSGAADRRRVQGPSGSGVTFKITVFESAVQNKLHCAFFCAKLNLCGNAIVGNGKIAFKSLE